LPLLFFSNRNLFLYINIIQKRKKLYLFVSIYNLVELILPFFCLMSGDSKIKNLKISADVHEILKKYCDKRGIKIYKFLENLIIENCKEKKDLYGED